MSNPVPSKTPSFRSFTSAKTVINQANAPKCASDYPFSSGIILLMTVHLQDMTATFSPSFPTALSHSFYWDHLWNSPSELVTSDRCKLASFHICTIYFPAPSGTTWLCLNHEKYVTVTFTFSLPQHHYIHFIETTPCKPYSVRSSIQTDNLLYKIQDTRYFICPVVCTITHI